MTFLQRLVRRRPAPAAEFDLTGFIPGTRWLACHTTICAHTTTRHIPHGTGYQCVSCGTSKGDQ